MRMGMCFLGNEGGVVSVYWSEVPERSKNGRGAQAWKAVALSFPRMRLSHKAYPPYFLQSCQNYAFVYRVTSSLQ